MMRKALEIFAVVSLGFAFSLPVAATADDPIDYSVIICVNYSDGEKFNCDSPPNLEHSDTSFVELTAFMRAEWKSLEQRPHNQVYLMWLFEPVGQEIEEQSNHKKDRTLTFVLKKENNFTEHKVTYNIFTWTEGRYIIAAHSEENYSANSEIGRAVIEIKK